MDIRFYPKRCLKLLHHIILCIRETGKQRQQARRWEISKEVKKKKNFFFFFLVVGRSVGWVEFIECVRFSIGENKGWKEKREKKKRNKY